MFPLSSRFHKRSAVKDEVFNNSKNRISLEKQKQLKFPHGKDGLEIGRAMFSGNADVIDRSISYIEFKPGLKICDIGCGPGYSLLKLSEQLESGEIIGIDRSVAMVDMAKENNEKKIKEGLVKILNTSTPSTGLKNDYFDYITLNNVIYFWANINSHIKEINRILKPGGKLIIYMVGTEAIKERIGESKEVFNLHTVKFVQKIAGENNLELEINDEFTRRIDEVGNVLVFTKH